MIHSMSTKFRRNLLLPGCCCDSFFRDVCCVHHRKILRYVNYNLKSNFTMYIYFESYRFVNDRNFWKISQKYFAIISLIFTLHRKYRMVKFHRNIDCQIQSKYRMINVKFAFQKHVTIQGIIINNFRLLLLIQKLITYICILLIN